LPVTVRPGRERLSRQSHRQQQQKANRKLHQHYSINEVAAGKSPIKLGGAPREASAIQHTTLQYTLLKMKT